MEEKRDIFDDLRVGQPKIGQRTPNAEKVVEVRHEDLPAYCPTPGSSVWNGHPRVYIPLKNKGDEARCIYCSAIFRLVS